MIVNYSKKDIKAWAEFSGDYNPIHFDINKALSYGLVCCPVQGMLGAMDVKTNIHTHSFSAKMAFKDYIHSEKDYEIITDGKKKIFFGEECLINCKISDFSFENNLTNLHNVEINDQDIVALKTFSDYRIASCNVKDQIWSLLDALLFRKIFKTKYSKPFLTFISDVLNIKSLNSINDIMALKFTVQISHEINVSEKALQLSTFDDLKYFSLKIADPINIFDDNEKLILEFNAFITYNDNIVLSEKPIILLKKK